MSALKGKMGNAFNGKHKDSVPKEMLAASATTTVSVERRHNRLLLLQDRRHKVSEKVLRKGSLPETP